MRILIIYFLVQILFFGTVLGYFSQCNFKICRHQPTMVDDILTQLPQHKKPSYGPDYVGNKAKERISKRIFQKYKARQIFRKTNSFIRKILQHRCFPVNIAKF